MQPPRLEAWEPSAPGAYVSIRAGGPLAGLVTITATGVGGRVTIEASWGVPHLRSSVTAERVGHAAGDLVVFLICDGCGVVGEASSPGYVAAPLTPSRRWPARSGPTRSSRLADRSQAGEVRRGLTTRL